MSIYDAFLASRQAKSNERYTCGQMGKPQEAVLYSFISQPAEQSTREDRQLKDDLAQWRKNCWQPKKAVIENISQHWPNDMSERMQIKIGGWDFYEIVFDGMPIAKFPVDDIGKCVIMGKQKTLEIEDIARAVASQYLDGLFAEQNGAVVVRRLDFITEALSRQNDRQVGGQEVYGLLRDKFSDRQKAAFNGAKTFAQRDQVTATTENGFHRIQQDVRMYQQYATERANLTHETQQRFDSVLGRYENF